MTTPSAARTLLESLKEDLQTEYIEIANDAIARNSMRHQKYQGLRPIPPGTKVSPVQAVSGPSIKVSIQDFQKRYGTSETYVKSYKSATFEKCDCLPRYKYYTPLAHNIDVPNEEKLFYYPYFGDGDEDTAIKFDELFQIAIKPAKLIDTEYMAAWYEPHVEEWLYKYNVNITDYDIVLNSNKKEKVTNKPMIQKIWQLEKIWLEVTKTRLRDVVSLHLARQKELLQTKDCSKDGDPFESYMLLQCPLCYKFDCHDHDLPRIKPTVSRLSTWVPYSDHQPCSNYCFLEEAHTTPLELSTDELKLLDLIISRSFPHARLSCLLSMFLQITCNKGFTFTSFKIHQCYKPSLKFAIYYKQFP
ncbi:hypothetical protein NEOLI_002832 isoform A [Neolecta irregularis DAH-3]|uniref:Uncharacterized protein n=1 Tax=Neolecta irregularis (strain DAH-3) TaxID=1198029 RepID=A0A1U7LSU6_NEOID|nr:hypothetical protein NEOLI_002832 isoform A [Neolecta irregularis DAH-3]|eukprot:OLL25591.1 hypothetical protein NEOLI_002832 isoform A [Neolecta irregularis DAH-3]